MTEPRTGFADVARTSSAEALPATHDAIIVGGGLPGLLSAYVLGTFGYRTCVIERSSGLGGLNASFRTARGRVFDYGYHAVDYDRSEFTTRLFEAILGDGYRVFDLARAIVLRGEIVPFAAPPERWPAALRALMTACMDSDDLGVLHPTRDMLARIYGRRFADLAFDEVLPSYPTLRYLLRQGYAEHELVQEIYPWFFPRVDSFRARDDESLGFHDRTRRAGSHRVLYPGADGFGTLIDRLVAKLGRLPVELVVGADTLALEADGEARRIRSATVAGRRITAPRFIWCAPPPALCHLFGLPAPSGKRQVFALGSFELSRPAALAYHEILVGDPAHLFNRLSLPGRMAGAENDRVQVEYLFPEGEHELDADSWRAAWEKSLRALGIVRSDTVVTGFDFHARPLGIVRDYDEAAPLAALRRTLAHPRSNVVVPYLGFGDENLARVVPGTVHTLVRAITESREGLVVGMPEGSPGIEQPVR